MNDTQLTFCDVEPLQSKDERDTLAAWIAGGFHVTLGVTPRGMNAAKEQVPLRPGMRVFA